ncbi:MAG TPA: helix-turn-helix domain-containing protein [Candidatus Magasanikbacteria bacterium]|nr:helix-turn-helix domain-containing protein [Candidatus Magasanikbacteria bacterium]
MNILEEVGLTKRESDIYTLLLSLGESRFSTIQKELGLHPQVVYRIIESLKEKGLVSVAKKKKVYHAIAETPRELLRIEKERLESLKLALPELLALQKSPSQPLIQISKGAVALRAFREKAYQQMKKGDVFYVIGGSGDRFYITIGERYDSIEQKRIDKKINKKLISVETEREKFLKHDTRRELSEFKFLPADFPIVSSTNVYMNTVGIIIWSEEPILITIENADVAESYKQYFRQLESIAVY